MGRKILMVGLGGTGCKAVARVRERVIRERMDEADRKNFSDIQFVGFDTDQTGSELYGTLPMVWTARSATVEDLLVGREEWKEWFPAENVYIRRRSGLAGAGQLRSLSRIMLEDTMMRENTADNPMAALNDAFNHLQQEDGDGQEAQVVVMIVSSFAGGTGSGIFIEIALLLRKLLHERMHCDTALIRGLFALPDIYTPTLHNDQEIESVYANAYASLKELSAINRLFSEDDGLAKDIHMRYGELFDSDHDRDESTKELPSYMVPYNTIFFVDNTNSNGKVLPSLEAYESMIAEIAYMQIYSPMASRMLSTEDNLIRSIIISRGQDIFASAGCSKIEYPHDDIVEYCVRRMMSDNLDSDWLFFDKQYRAQLEEAKKRRQTDRSVKLPKRAESFVSTVEQFLDQSTSQFSYLRDEIMFTQEADDKNPDPQPMKRQELFMEALTKYLKEQIVGKSAANESVRRAAAEASMDDFGRKREDMIKKIAASERKLQKYLDTVKEQIPMVQGSVVYEILPESMVVFGGRKSFCLSKLLKTADGKAVHPTSARYLLYSMKLLMEEGLKKAVRDAKAAETKIDSHFGKDWNDRKEGRQTAAQSVPAFHKRSFAEEYAGDQEKCYKNIGVYAENKLTEAVFGDCLARVNEMIIQYEQFYDCLTDILADNQREANRLETMHSFRNGITTYIQASPMAKRMSYQKIAGIHADSQTDLYDSILTELYSSVLAAEEQKQKLRYADDVTRQAMGEKLLKEMGRRIRKLFEEDVADTFRRLILADPSDAVNINVIRAMEKECEALTLTGQYMDESEPRREILKDALARANPLLMYDKNTAGGHSKVFWGISDSADDALHGQGQEYFGKGSEVYASARYSEYEIACYQAVYELGLMDIMKFRDSGKTQGIYYKNYMSLRKKMEKSGGTQRRDALTPHTDKRWLTGLPMISNERIEEERSDAARVFWLGLLLERVKVAASGGSRRFVVVSIDKNGHRSAEELLMGGAAVAPLDYLGVYQALSQNATMLEELKNTLEDEYAANKQVKAQSETSLLQSKNPLVAALIDQTGKKATNPLTILGRMMKDGLGEDQKLLDMLSNALFDVVNQLKMTKAGMANLQHLIYRYSRYYKYQKAWMDFEPEWLDDWKSPDDVQAEPEATEENEEEE